MECLGWADKVFVTSKYNRQESIIAVINNVSQSYEKKYMIGSIIEQRGMIENEDLNY